MVSTGILSSNIRSPSPEWYTFWMMTIYRDTLLWLGITPIFDPVTDLDLITQFDFLPNCTSLPSSGMFAYNTCIGSGMPKEDAYSSGHLVLSHFGICKCSNVETNLSWTCLVARPLSFEHPSVLLFCLNHSTDASSAMLVYASKCSILLWSCITNRLLWCVRWQQSLNKAKTLMSYIWHYIRGMFCVENTSSVSPACCKRRLNGAVCRNHRIKRVVPCRCRTGTLKNPAKCLWCWEPDRRYSFFFYPPAHLCRHIYDWNTVACDVNHQ